MSVWLDGIEERLSQGSAPTEDEIRELIRQNKDAQKTLQVCTRAALEFATTVLEAADQRQRKRPAQVFDDRAGQFIDK